jgi:hypothetical protein
MGNMDRFTFLIVFSIVFLDLVWVFGSKTYFKNHPLTPGDPIEAVVLNGKFSPGFTLIRLWIWKIRCQLRHGISIPQPGLEILLVVVWAIWAGRGVLDFTQDLMPPGMDFSLAVRGNYFWVNLLKCGSCALWNGNYDGGFPALVDLLAAPLHPIVALPTIAFGVINGGKVTIVLSLALAGLSQLWIGRTLGLSMPARLWGALMAVVAGSITGRMEIGQVTLLVSTASGMLWIAALLHIHKNWDNRSFVYFAVSTGLLLISGQGYIQIAIALAILPAALILFHAPRPNRGEWFEKLQFASVLGILSAAVLLVPILNNLSTMHKETNLSYSTTYPLFFQLGNLFILDQDFLYQLMGWESRTYFDTLNYVGFGPVVLALIAPLVVPRKNFRELKFLLVSIVLVYFCSTMVTPRLLFDWIDPYIAAGIRHPGVMAGLAGSLILTLAAWTMDRLLIFFASSPRPFLRHFGFILIVILSAVSLIVLYSSSQRWLSLQKFDVDRSLVKYIRPSQLEWVKMPDNHYWNLLAFEEGIKLTGTFHPWQFSGKIPPPPALTLSRDPLSSDWAHLARPYQDFYFSRSPENHYAFVNTSGVLSNCPAQASGGWIQATCNLQSAGTLVVMEHSWSGWEAFVDGVPVHLKSLNWLAVDLAKGKHTIEFRYLPWDVFVGFVISLIACVLLGLWWKKSPFL